jgi:hypothetical protein
VSIFSTDIIFPLSVSEGIAKETCGPRIGIVMKPVEEKYEILQ